MLFTATHSLTCKSVSVTSNCIQFIWTDLRGHRLLLVCSCSHHVGFYFGGVEKLLPDLGRKNNHGKTFMSPGMNRALLSSDPQCPTMRMAAAGARRAARTGTAWEAALTAAGQPAVSEHILLSSTQSHHPPTPPPFTNTTATCHPPSLTMNGSRLEAKKIKTQIKSSRWLI